MYSVTTAEKWDSLTRNWYVVGAYTQEMLFQLDHRSEHDKILSQIQVFLVDEVCISLSLTWTRIYLLS